MKAGLIYDLLPVKSDKKEIRYYVDMLIELRFFDIISNGKAKDCSYHECTFRIW
jgi:hypothetical protein